MSIVKITTKNQVSNILKASIEENSTDLVHEDVKAL